MSDQRSMADLIEWLEDQAQFEYWQAKSVAASGLSGAEYYMERARWFGEARDALAVAERRDRGFVHLLTEAKNDIETGYPNEARRRISSWLSNRERQERREKTHATSKGRKPA